MKSFSSKNNFVKCFRTSVKKNINVKEAFETLGRELMAASGDKRITKEKPNKKISVSKAQDLNVQKQGGCC